MGENKWENLIKDNNGGGSYVVMILCWIHKEEKKGVKIQVSNTKLKIIRGSNNKLVIIFIYISRATFNSKRV